MYEQMLRNMIPSEYRHISSAKDIVIAMARDNKQLQCLLDNYNSSGLAPKDFLLKQVGNNPQATMFLRFLGIV